MQTTPGNDKAENKRGGRKMQTTSGNDKAENKSAVRADDIGGRDEENTTSESIEGSNKEEEEAAEKGKMIGSGGFLNLLKSQERFKEAKSNENMTRTHMEESSEENLNDTEEEDEVGEEEETTSDGDSEMDEMDGRLVQYEEFQEEQVIEKTKGQWVIPGATYQTSMPNEELGVAECFARETLRVGGTFERKEEMTIALGMYNLQNRVETVVLSSDKRRYSAVCKHNEECTFAVRATCQGTVWKINKWKLPHTCEMDYNRHGPRSVPAKVIGAYFAPTLMTEGAILRPKDMQAQLRRLYGVDIEYSVALSGRNHAISMVYGDNDKSFQDLPAYLYTMQEANRGSVVELETDSEERFQYAYMAIGASINGFRACGRPVIVIDGTHLKGKYKGIMFVAATKDGNEQIYPLAVGIGDVENDNSWTWFLRQIRRTFDRPENLLFVSDQHRSIQNAVETVYPGTPHGLCSYHLQKNLKQWGANVVAMYQEAAYSYHTQDFERHMNSISKASPEGAYKKLLGLDPKRWTRSRSEVRRYGFMTSNCAESLNGRLRWARRLPVCSLLECVRKLVSQWFYNRRTNAAKRTDDLTEYASKKVIEAVEHGRTMNVDPISLTKFQVTSQVKHYIVDLGRRTCSCQKFQYDQIPCSHAAAAISKSNEKLQSYVARYYTMENIRQMYAGDIMPIINPEEWNVPAHVKARRVETPKNPRQAGRPRMSRIPTRGETVSGARKQICSRCKKVGHKRSSCKEYIMRSQEIEELDGGQSSSRKKRRAKHCSICHVVGHTRVTCPKK